MAESNKLYELIGKVKDRKIDRVRNKKSPHYGNHYLRCQVVIEDEPEIKEILVFENWLEKKDIWQTIEQGKYLGKRYHIFCQRKPGAGRVYRLINWKELENHGSN